MVMIVLVVEMIEEVVMIVEVAEVIEIVVDMEIGTEVDCLNRVPEEDNRTFAIFVSF